MSITKYVRALLSVTGKRQRDLLLALGLANEQSLSNKFRGERWSAADLVTVAEFTGAKLAFILPNGERIVISSDPAPGGVPLGDMAGAEVGGVSSVTTEN